LIFTHVCKDKLRNTLADNFLARVFDRPFLLFGARRNEHANVQISGELKNRDEKLCRSCLRRMVFEEQSATAKKSTERGVVTCVFVHALQSFAKLSVTENLSMEDGVCRPLNLARLKCRPKNCPMKNCLFALVHNGLQLCVVAD